MIKRNKALLCALASIGIITSFNTTNVNAMANTNTTKVYKASQVQNLICDLPYSIDLDRQSEITSQIQEARGAYNSLPEDEKSDVSRTLVSRLGRMESLLKDIVEDEIESIGIAYVTKELATVVGYNNNTRSVNNLEILKSNSRQIRDVITDMKNAYQGLDYSVKYRSGFGDYMSVLGAIEHQLYVNQL